jgi:CheY-like chemotaxis protein
MDYTHEATLSPEYIYPDVLPTICIVEDDPATGEVLKLIIEEETLYRPLLFVSGADMLHALSGIKPLLFIFDYFLPDMTGVELFDYLQTQQRFRNVPAILASASKQIDEIDAHTMVMVSKPFDLDEFLAVIEQLIASATVSC